MKVSVNHIRYYQRLYNWSGDPAPDGVDALAERIGAQLGAIEEVIDNGARYEGIVIARVVSCTQHPNADKLHVCKIDDGGKVAGVERDERGYVQVVCGAPNVREGLLVAWLPPGATVPESLGPGKDPFVLEARELRGVMSNGMLASPRELGIGDNHDGILEINDADDMANDMMPAPGADFAKQYELAGDVVFDIENKMFTHRPDCFGMMGVAREIAGIQHQAFYSPDWYRVDADIPKPRLTREDGAGTPLVVQRQSGDTLSPANRQADGEALSLEVRNELPELVPRFLAIAMSGVEVKPSPLWLQIALTQLGVRPINNIVDWTNYTMLLTGQPVHAYDYDKVAALDGSGSGGKTPQATLVVRYPYKDETLTLLNGKTIKPREEAIVIASATKAIGLAGVMGGGETEVDEQTKNIILEVATFDMYSIRRTSMTHGLFTDAVTRFNKGQSPLQNRAVMAKLIEDISNDAGGKVASELIDDNHVPTDVLERQSIHPPVTLTAEFINSRLGLSLQSGEIAQLLRNVEFEVVMGVGSEARANGPNVSHREDGGSADSLTVKAPFWRTDIEIPEDVVEEVGRLYGYDHLPLELPMRPMIPAPKNRRLELKQIIRDTLSRAGANEVLLYSFVHSNLFKKVGQDPAQAYQLSNALSPDLQYFRLSLTPSLLERVHPNIKAGYNEFALFEIGKAHAKGKTDEADSGLPMEFERVALVFAADTKAASKYDGAAYYQARVYLDNLLQALNITGSVTFEPFEARPGAEGDSIPTIRQKIDTDNTATDTMDVAAAYYEPGRSAVIKVAGVVIGRIGEYKQSVRKALKLPEYCAGFELGIEPLAQVASEGSSYTPLSRYPMVEQDICLKVAADMSYQKAHDFVMSQIESFQTDNLRISLSPIDIYRRDDDPDHKQVTLRLSVVSYTKTLRDEEVVAMLDTIALAAQELLGAERV